MLDPLIDPASREAPLRAIYARLRFADACCVVGINDVGKTTLLSLVAQAATIEQYGPELREPRLFVRIDCNLLAGAGEHDLYALMAAETRAAARHAGVPLDTAGPGGTADESPLIAAVGLETMLVQLVDQGQWPVYLFDEFDEFYHRLEARAALALRAFENRLGPRIAYVVAVERPLREVRGAADTAEFEELFVGGTQALPPLERRHSAEFVRRYAAQRGIDAPTWLADALAAATGGHPGLLWAALAAAPRVAKGQRERAETELAAAPEVVAECENVWERLSERERVALASGTPPMPLLARHARAVAGAAQRGLIVHHETGEVTVDGRPLGTRLGPTEFRLLQILAQHAGTLVTKDEIASAVWPREQRLSGVDDARIDKLIDRVRAKIEPDPRTPRFLVTVRGLGYRLLTGAAT